MNNNAPTSKNANEPVTALPSSLSKRAAPNIPSAEVVYEPLVKTILARRFVSNVLSTSAAASWFLAAIWTSWQLGGLKVLGVFGGIINWLSPLTLLSALLFWSLACAPIAVMRKVFLQATYAPSVSPRQTLLQHATERHYQISLVSMLISSACLAFFHSFVAQTFERSGNNDPKLGLWAGSRKHPYHLNGRFCFLVLAQTTCALLYWLRDVLRSRFSIRWTSEVDVLIQTFPLLRSSLISVLTLSATSTVITLLLFGIFRTIALPILYRFPIIHNLLRPFVAHFLRPTYTISLLWMNFGLVFRAFVLALSSHILWDVPSIIFDDVFSVPVEATDGSKDSALILVSGINSPNTYFQLQAFHDLSSVASDADQAASGRAVIYNDTKYTPTLWSMWIRRSLLLLGSDYQLFLRRGNPPAPPPQVPEAPAAKPLTPASQSSVIRTQVYKAPQPTPIDRIAETLASDSPFAGALAKSTGDSTGLCRLLEGTFSSQIQATQVTIRSLDPSSVARDAVKTISDTIPIWLQVYDIGTWWTRERKDRAARKALPNKELDVMIVKVLSKMVANSLREDVLGYVQRDIPCILEAMVSFLLATEEHQIEISKFVAEKKSSAEVAQSEVFVLREEAARATQWVEELSEALRIGIALIVNTFGDRLTKYRFPPRIALKIQTFADYVM